MRGLLVLATAIAMLVIACSSPASQATSYDLTEFEINGPTDPPAGASSLTVSNSGEFPHTLVVADESGTVIAATDLVQPGETVQLDVQLSEGTFQFTCRIVAQRPDGELVDHFEEGMVETVVVGG